MKKTTVGLTVCAVLASGMTGVVTLAQEVLDEQQSHQETQNEQTATSQNADVSGFTLENHPDFAAYQQQFAIKAERIQISANKPNYGDLTYAAMMDGDKATYWAPSTRDDVEKTEVEFTFDELVTLDQITYSARQNVATDSGGFPHQFEIYGAMADDAEYTLVASGSEATATKSTIAIQFPATQFKKLKFKFVETSTKTKWAHIGEIAFYQPDALMTTMADLFTTPEKNVVNPSYADLETLANLLIEAKAHPFAAEYVTSITDAQALLTHEAITTTTAKMQAFKHYDNAAYQALFKIPSEQIANISNNAGHYSNRVLTNAIDNDVSTYWETNKANTATWNNEVIVTFTDVVEFNRIVFGARPDKKGFATKFEVYASPTVEGETFELLATGEQNAVTGLVEAQFDSTQMKRVKFKFVGATQNWATLSELAFYQQDHVVDAMNNLFTDETKSALNEAYMNEAALTQLSQAVANHPFADQYTTALEDAWILQKRTPAQVEIAKTEMFTHFENEAYTSAFKMPSSNIATIKNNGGHYASRVIKNAIDDDLSTYWETNTSNKTNWKNEVEVIFHNRETLNRMVFGARPDLKGFAAKFEIYASNTTEGDTYELIATGKHNAQTGLVEAKFEAREIKRIKLKFIDSLENWATLSELAFYQVDELTEVVENDIFMDKTYVALTPAYQSHEALEALREVVEQHPASATLMPIVERAFQVLEGNATNEGLVVTAIQDGNMNTHAKQVLSMIRGGQDLQSIGLYGLAGEKIVVYVDVDESTDAMPLIGFSQYNAKYQKWLETYQLKPGRNEFIVPTFNVDDYHNKVTQGGAIYISNPYTAEEQGRAPKIRIEGGHSFPVYREGADEAAFIEELTAYYTKYTAAQAAGDQSVLNLMEVEGERVLLSVTATAGYQVYVNEGLQPHETTDEWTDLMESLFTFHGMDGRSEIHDPKQVKEHVRLMQPHGMMYASSSHVGIQSGHTASVLRPGLFGSWGIVHEVGHRFDNRYRTWNEVTNNMDAMYLSAISGQMRDRVNYEEVYKKTAVYNDAVAFGDGGYFTMLGMIWQLHLVNDQYWPLLNSLYREEKPTINNEQDRYDYLVKYSSQVLGLNLTEHFARHGMKVSPEVAAELATAYPGETLKYWYLNTKAYDYQGTGLAEQTTTKIENIKLDGTLTILSDAVDADLLGYEIYRNDELIGFTRTNTFTDENYSTDENSNYVAVPYGVDLVAGNASEVYQSYTPVVELTTSEVYLPLYATFDPLAYVQAYNYLGESIVGQVVVSSTVDVNQKGSYEVNYTLTDQEATVTKTLLVHVVAEAVSLSNFDWQTATQEYSEPKKDINLNGKGLSLTGPNGEAIAYEKGLGTHANAEIVYHLPTDEYVRFESYIGIDHDMSKKAGTITFEVYVDGVKRYDSGVMKAGDAQKYLSVDIAGASELKLVITDAGNGNGADHATWGNPVLLAVSAKPELSIPDAAVYEVGSQLDETTLIGSYQAHDVEDGDLTDQVQVTGFETVVTTKPGNYEITYRVTDREGNTTTKIRQVAIADLADYDYLTDYEWTKATQSYSTTHKDQHASGTPLRLTDEFGASVTYERGLGTHANAEIVYDLTQTDAVIFSTYVGVDRVMYNSTASSIIFEIYVDGKKVAATDVMRAKTPQQYLQVDIAGAKELKLVVNNAGNGNGSDHGSFGDAKLHYVNDARADLTPLQTLITELDALDTTSYSAASVEILQAQLAAAKALIAQGDVMQVEADAMFAALIQAREQLVVASYEVFIPDAELKQGIMQTLGLTSETIMSHELERLEALDLEGSYVRDLTGLEYAINLKSLNLNYTEVTDLRPLQHLTNLTDLQVNESFLDRGQATYVDGFFILEPTAVFDRNGQVVEPSEFVLSSGVETMTLPVESVYVDGVIKIDAKLFGAQSLKSLEIKYASDINAFSVYTFHWLQLPSDVDVNPIVEIKDEVLRTGIVQALKLESEELRVSDLANLTQLDLEGSYVRDLTGLEHAVNLESLNLNYTEVTDLRPLQHLTNLTDLQVNESFLDRGQATYVDGFFILEPTAVFDRNGQVVEPSEFVLSSGVETMTLPVESVYVDGVIKIDARLFGGQSLKSLEIKYASDINAFSVYTFHWLQLPSDVDVNPIVEIKDEALRTGIVQALKLESEELRVSDLANLTQLDLEGSYVRDLTGLEYAVNLESLNINYNEVSDLRPLKNLPKFTQLVAEENFINQADATFDGLTFTIEPMAVFDRNGQKLEPLEIVVSVGSETLSFPITEVSVNGKIQIDAKLLGDKKVGSVEIMYASTQTNFSVFTYHWLKK